MNVVQILIRFVELVLIGALRGIHREFSTNTEDTITSAELGEMLGMLAEAAAESEDRVLVPFAAHMKKHFSTEAVKSTSGTIEALTAALHSLGDEIRMMLPTSTVVSTIEREEAKGGDVLRAHLDWRVDEYTPLVYDICIDLLKDGFIFRADSKTFVITTKIKK